MTLTEKNTLKPTGNRVLLKKEKATEATVGGIILPETAQKKPETATVIAVGPGISNKEGTLIPMFIQKGQTVLIDKYSGQEISIDDEEHIIIKEDDIIAIVE